MTLEIFSAPGGFQVALVGHVTPVVVVHDHRKHGLRCILGTAKMKLALRRINAAPRGLLAAKRPVQCFSVDTLRHYVIWCSEHLPVLVW